MSGNCPLCGAPLNLGLNFCVVCGRRSSGGESSKMVGLKSAARQSDLTQKIDISDGRFKRAGKPKVALRFRKVRGLWSQVFYVFVGISLFFCAIRYVLEPKKFYRASSTQRSFLAGKESDQTCSEYARYKTVCTT